MVIFCVFQEKVAKTACMSACKHIAQSLLEFLLDNNVTVMTSHALQMFSKDVLQCEGKCYLVYLKSYKPVNLKFGSS